MIRSAEEQDAAAQEAAWERDRAMVGDRLAAALEQVLTLLATVTEEPLAAQLEAEDALAEWRGLPG